MPSLDIVPTVSSSTKVPTVNFVVSEVIEATNEVKKSVQNLRDVVSDNKTPIAQILSTSPLVVAKNPIIAAAELVKKTSSPSTKKIKKTKRRMKTEVVNLRKGSRVRKPVHKYMNNSPPRGLNQL
jgi:hypothetical protein